MKRLHRPNASHFKPGQSGNPRGRPKGRHRTIPHDGVFGQMVTVSLDGVEQRMTAGEFFFRRLIRSALAGGRPLDDVARRLLERGREERGEALEGGPWVVFVAADNAQAMERLGMVTKARRYQANTRLLIEPWLVERALARLGDRRLTVEEQADVQATTRTPHKVNWPAWWGEG